MVSSGPSGPSGPGPSGPFWFFKLCKNRPLGMFDIGHVGQDLVLDRWFKYVQMFKKMRIWCVFFLPSCFSFLFGFEIREVPNHQPPSSSDWDYDNNSPSISSLMGCKGNVDTWRSDANRKTIGASVSLGFCWVPKKPDEESTNETSAWTNHQQ